MKSVFNIIFYLIIIVLFIKKIPGIYENYKSQNQFAPSVSVRHLSGEEISVPVAHQKTVVVFWATWCGPCQVELKRLNQMILDHKIKANQVLAISVQESKETVDAFLKNNKFEFLIALDESGQASEAYHVRGTPTVVFINEDSKIAWMTTGLSPSLEFRVQHFFVD